AFSVRLHADMSTMTSNRLSTASRRAPRTAGPLARRTVAPSPRRTVAPSPRRTVAPSPPRTVLVLLQRRVPIDVDVRPGFDLAVRPGDPHVRWTRGLSQSDDDTRIVGGGVAAVRASPAPARGCTGLNDLNTGTKHVASADPGQPQADPVMTGRGLVDEQPCRSGVVADEDGDVARVVDVAECRTAADLG